MSKRKSINNHLPTPFNQKQNLVTTPTSQMNPNLNENYSTDNTTINTSTLKSNSRKVKLSNLKLKIQGTSRKIDRLFIDNEADNSTKLVNNKHSNKPKTKYYEYQNDKIKCFRRCNQSSRPMNTNTNETFESKALNVTWKKDVEIKDDLRTIECNIRWLSEKIRNMGNIFDIQKKKYHLTSALNKVKINKQQPIKIQRKKIVSVNPETKDSSIWSYLNKVRWDEGRNNDKYKTSQVSFVKNATQSVVNKADIYFKPLLKRSSFSLNSKNKQTEEKNTNVNKTNQKWNESINSINLSDIADDIFNNKENERYEPVKELQQNNIFSHLKIASSPSQKFQYICVQTNFIIQNNLNSWEIKTNKAEEKSDKYVTLEWLPNETVRNKCSDNSEDEDKETYALINHIRNQTESWVHNNNNNNQQLLKQNTHLNKNSDINYKEENNNSAMESHKTTTNGTLNSEQKNSKLPKDPELQFEKKITNNLIINPNYITYETGDYEELITESESKEDDSYLINKNNYIRNIRKMFRRNEESETDEHYE